MRRNICFLGIGDLITDLDADIEKSSFVNIHHTSHENKDTSSTDKTEKIVVDKAKTLQTPQIVTMSSTSSGSGNSKAMKLAVDHQATLEKGLKMKIKRTKPGTKTSEAKHVIVKSEQNGFPIERDDSNIGKFFSIIFFFNIFRNRDYFTRFK